jgi:hypothetical protein
MAELIEREETEAMRRIQAGLRRRRAQADRAAQRILTRATASYSDAAAQQFADTVRGTREASATRLSRELDRSVQSFVREAQTVLAGPHDARSATPAALRLERRLAEVTESLDRQRTRRSPTSSAA